MTSIFYSVARGNPPGQKRITGWFYSYWTKQPQRDPFTHADGFGQFRDDADTLRCIEAFANGRNVVQLDAEWARAARHAKLGHLPWPAERRVEKKRIDAEFAAATARFYAKLPKLEGARRLGLPPFDRFRRMTDRQLGDLIDLARSDQDLRDAILHELQCRLRESRATFKARCELGEDPRSVLGVTVAASPDDIKRAFRRRALETHPDRGGDPAEFRRVKQAYDAMRGEV